MVVVTVVLISTAGVLYVQLTDRITVYITLSVCFSFHPPDYLHLTTNIRKRQQQRNPPQYREGSSREGSSREGRIREGSSGEGNSREGSSSWSEGSDGEGNSGEGSSREGSSRDVSSCCRDWTSSCCKSGNWKILYYATLHWMLMWFNVRVRK